MEDTQQRQISLDCYLNRSNAAVQRILKKHFQRPAGLAQRYLLTITGFFLHRKRIAELPIAGKLAVIGPASLMVEAGLLMSYGANWWAVARSAAPLVKKILEGKWCLYAFEVRSLTESLPRPRHRTSNQQAPLPSNPVFRDCRCFHCPETGPQK